MRDVVLKMTTEERIRSLHARMDRQLRAREQRKTALTGAAGVVLAVCLILMIVSDGGKRLGGSPAMYSGAALLFEGAGAYVLIAIVAFMAGVIVTYICIKHKKRRSR